MTRTALAATALIAALAASLSPAGAQTANSSPTSGTGAGAGNVVRTAPAGSTAVPHPGQPQVGAPTPLERDEERKSQKETGSVCKGC